MKTVWVEKTLERRLRSSLRALLQYLLVDVIPIILLLAIMACGMAFVSHKLTEPRTVEVKAVVEKLS